MSKLTVPVPVKMSGRFKLVTSGGKRGTIDHGWHGNLILNSGFAKLFEYDLNQSVLRYISVGSGSSTPTVTQSTLDSIIATTDRNKSYTYGYVAAGGGDPAYGRTIFEVQFARGVAAGNISEMGATWKNDGSVLFSRALIKDGGGTPTSITVLADEFLTVTYELRRFVAPDWSDTINWDDDGTPTATTVSWTSGVNTTNYGNGSGGDVLFAGNTLAFSVEFGSMLGLYGLEWAVKYGLEQGNPTIAETEFLGAAIAGRLIPYGSKVTYSPALPKTNEYEITIDLLITLSQV